MGDSVNRSASSTANKFHLTDVVTFNTKNKYGTTSFCNCSRRVLILTSISVSILLIILLTLVCLFANGPYSPSDEQMYTNEEDTTSTDVMIGRDGSIVLVGDSLMHHTFMHFDLRGRMNQLTPYSFEYTDCARNGYQINNILTDFLPLLSASIRNITQYKNISLNINSAGQNIDSTVMVLLFFHADASDVDETGKTNQEIRELPSNFKTRLRFFTQSILNSGAYMAIAGPGVYPWYFFKTAMMNDYQKMYIEVAEEFEMEYIDVRGAFLESINKGRNPTMFGDNEHPNNHGASIMAELFMSTVHRWKSGENILECTTSIIGVKKGLTNNHPSQIKIPMVLNPRQRFA
eukprot:gene12406-26101_t